MASTIIPPSLTADAAANVALVPATFTPHECAYCGSLIVSGEPWVREKIYEPFTANAPRYYRYHSDLFDGEELSCWEKHEMERENVRAARRTA